MVFSLESEWPCWNLLEDWTEEANKLNVQILLQNAGAMAGEPAVSQLKLGLCWPFITANS